MLRWTLYVICVLGLFACGNQERQNPAPSLKECSSLDSLFQALDGWQSTFSAAKGLDQTRPQLDRFLDLLQNNQVQKADSCNYLDHSYHPNRSRFSFVETIVEASIQDTLSTGIFYLLKTRNIFARDPEITEYLSEEMASLARRNPHAYIRYLRQNPEQQKLVLSSTRWPRNRLQQLEALFAPLPDGTQVATYLKELREELSIQ